MMVINHALHPFNRFLEANPSFESRLSMISSSSVLPFHPHQSSYDLLSDEQQDQELVKLQQAAAAAAAAVPRVTKKLSPAALKKAAATAAAATPTPVVVPTTTGGASWQPYVANDGSILLPPGVFDEFKIPHCASCNSNALMVHTYLPSSLLS